MLPGGGVGSRGVFRVLGFRGSGFWGLRFRARLYRSRGQGPGAMV